MILKIPMILKCHERKSIPFSFLATNIECALSIHTAFLIIQRNEVFDAIKVMTFDHDFKYSHKNIRC